MQASDVSALLAFDRAHVWHPYSSVAPATRDAEDTENVEAGASPSTRFVESAHGIHLRLVDDDGTRHDVIDAMSSWWCAVHGYNVPELNAAAVEQLGRMAHVMFGGLTHEPAVRLAERLLAIAPHPEPEREPLLHVFFADSGSVSVEGALKMALQCFAADARPRRRLFTLRGGYHGDTLHPMSVCDPEGGMHALWHGALPEQVFGPLPPPAGLAADSDELERWKRETACSYEEFADDIAAVILEPVVQGAGGMRIYDPECVRFVAELARRHGALVIFDEIATGFGRTGTRWAADRVGVTPDILCVGKALAGGYLTMAAVLCTPGVAHTISERTGAVMHGPTFMGNPLACAVALASLDLLDDDRLARAASFDAILERHLGGLRALEQHGAGAGASRLVTSTHPVHTALERELAAFMGHEAALVFSTGYHANLALMTVLGTADTLIVSDAHNHASLIDGMRLSRARVAVTPHLDVEAVGRALAERTEPRAVIVVESIFSVLDDATPLPELLDLAVAHDALLVVDEAHGLGVVGERGEGLVAHLGLTPGVADHRGHQGSDRVVVTMTLSKSLASQGGAVLGSPLLREHLLNTARPFIFDTGLAPASAGAALAALRHLVDHPELPARTRLVARALQNAVSPEAGGSDDARNKDAQGHDTQGDDARKNEPRNRPAGAVLSVPMPSPQAAVDAVEAARARGVRIGCFRPPSTPDGVSRLRLTANAGVTDDELADAATVLAELTASRAILEPVPESPTTSPPTRASPTTRLTPTSGGPR